MIPVSINTGNADAGFYVIFLLCYDVFFLFVCFSAYTQITDQGKPLVGKTTGSLPYLEYGMGSDPTDYPNCLVEVAFLSNKEDEQLILDPEFHKAVATQI